MLKFLKDRKNYKLSRDLAIDLGTANVLVYAEGEGIVLREPSVVAIDKNNGKVLQVGAAARNMLGRTPGNVIAVRPLRNGVISDYEMTERMLAEFLKKIIRYALVKPRVVVCVPSGVTEVEERAVIQAAMEAGARRVYLIEEPFAAGLGAGLDLSGPNGCMVVDIGGGTTDIAVLCLNDIAVSSSIKIAGDTFDDTIIAYIRRQHGMLIGANTAEDIKTTIGCVIPRPRALSMTVKGRDLRTGLPKEVTVTSSELMEVLQRPARAIVEEVVAVLEQTSPELVADIDRNGIVLTGGGSQIWGIDVMLRERTKIACVVADSPDTCVALGCGKSLQWINSMQEGTINIARKKLMRD
ncbi:MAG: rod shape-determining protein [Oscillospiraceae bacterium]|nr:rod shape-determining protein [Oscillospiraceae bacterium]